MSPIYIALYILYYIYSLNTLYHILYMYALYIINIYIINIQYISLTHRYVIYIVYHVHYIQGV